jgi:hypothetical protein
LGPSSVKVPVTPLFSGVLFLFKLINTLKYLLEQNKIETENENRKDKLEVINETLSKIKNFISPCVHILKNCKCLDDFSNEIKGKGSLFFNKSLLSPCNIHGIKITGTGPTVGAFHSDILPEGKTSKNIIIKNVNICDLKSKVDEEIIYGNKDAEPYHVGAGLKLSESLMKSKILKCVVKNIYGLSKCNTIKDFIKTNLNNDVCKFINKQDNHSNNITIIRNCDSMGHINKGSIGVRLGSTKNVCLKNINVKNIYNLGLQNSELINKISKERHLQVIVPDSTLLNRNNIIGAFSIGMIISSSQKICSKNINIENVVSCSSSGVGIAINNKSSNVRFIRSSVNKIISGPEGSDSYVYLLDNECEDIKLCSVYKGVV